MLLNYRRIWGGPSGAVPHKLTGGLLFVVSVALPLALAMVVYDPVITKVVGAAVAILAGLVFFYDARRFAAFVLPLMYLVVVDRLILALVILLLVALAAELVARSELKLDIPYPVVLFILIVSGLNGIARGLDRDLARWAFQYGLALPLITFIVFYNLRPTTWEIRAHLTGVSVVAAVIGWVSLAMWLQTGVPRAMFSMVSQNMAACFLGMILPYALIEVLDAPQGWQRLLRAVTFIGVLVGILATQARAALIGGLMTMVYIAAKDRRALKVILPAIIVAAVALPGLIIYRLALMLGMGSIPDWSSVGRVQIWTNSLTYVPQYFLFGMGIESFQARYQVDFPYSFIRAVHPHNIILRWLFEFGIFGLATYLGIILLSLRRGMKAVRTLRGEMAIPEERLLLALNGGVISAMSVNLVDSTMNRTIVAMLLWTTMAFQLILAKRVAAIRFGPVGQTFLAVPTARTDIPGSPDRQECLSHRDLTGKNACPTQICPSSGRSTVE